jgi:hypothetical protein
MHSGFQERKHRFELNRGSGEITEGDVVERKVVADSYQVEYFQVVQ